MSKTITSSMLKEILSKMSEKEKTDCILKIFSTSKECKQAIQLYFGVADCAGELEKAKKHIDTYIGGRSGYRLEKAKAKQAITQYRKATQDLKGKARVMLYYVSKMDRFSQSYGDIDEAFYTSAENTFAGALDTIDKAGCQKELFEEVKNVAEKIIKFGYGWGFTDIIGDYFDEWKQKNGL